MTTLLELLRQYPTNSALVYYKKEASLALNKGMFYLGGQLPIRQDEKIEKSHIALVEHKNKFRGMPANTCEQASSFDHDGRFEEFKRLYHQYLSS